MSASLALPPLEDSDGAIFLKTQFRTKPRPPPDTTSFAGQTAIVTGSNGGLGLESSRLMLSYGLSHLIMGVRTVSKGEAVAAPLRKQYPGAQIDVWPLDMVSYDSVQAFAAKCAALPRLDVAILNAGINRIDFVLSPHGHEETLQVNYLSTALLAILLLPPLKASGERTGSGPGRLTIVSSNMALTSKFANRDKVPLISSFDDPGPKWDYNVAGERYQTTKTLVLMLVQKLSEQVSPDHVIVNAVDPALVRGTAMNRHFPLTLYVMHSIAKAVASRKLEEGAWIYIDAVATKGKESHGGFVMNWEIYPFHRMMYTPEGRKTTEVLWEETLKELDFAGVPGILASMQHGPDA